MMEGGCSMKKLEATKIEDCYGVHEELECLRTQMKRCPVLDELLGLQEGRALILRNLDRLFSDSNQKVVVVDWIFVNKRLFIIVANDRQLTRMMELKCEANLANWIKKYISTDHKAGLQYPVENPLRDLDFLIAPLITEPNALLILSPSELLHSIPLHALQLPNGQLLIERNPVVYCSNISILNHCYIRAITPHEHSDFVAAAVFPDDATEQEKIYPSLEKNANMFNGTLLKENQVAKATLKPMAERAAILHFHGYAVQDLSGNILDHELRFSASDEVDEVQAPHSPSSSPEDDIDDDFEFEKIADDPPSVGWTARDIFSLTLQAPLVTLIACESAQQEVLPGDEPLGLISAFLLSGAASVLGTLWTIRSVDGRTFADEFYRQIHQQCIRYAERGGGSGIVDLALAMQRAVLKIRGEPDTQAPYHWAAFILNGTWKIPALKVRGSGASDT